MNSINSPEFSRNYGFWSEDEQRALMVAHVAIAGVGGDGFQLGQKLAMMGVGNFSIADPEAFEPQNTNRVPGSTHSTYGRNKAEVFLEKVHDINPDVNVSIYEDGVTQENLREFMSGATLLLDESELTKPAIGTMLARQARKQNIPNLMVMNVGFAGQATSFHPTRGKTFEKLLGISETAPLDEIAEQEIKLNRCLPYLPRYGDLSTLTAVQQGASLPSIAQGVDIASGLGSTQAFLHMTAGVKNRRPQPVWAPKFAVMDAMTIQGKIISAPRIGHYRHLAHAVIRDMLHFNPNASYENEARERRAKAHLDSR